MSCAVLLVAACGGDAREAPRVELPVVVDGSTITAVTSDLGYEVTLSSARLAVQDLEFTVAGEVHSSLLRQLRRVLVSPAHAHPGHYQGGEVTGELTGQYIIDWLGADGEELGLATLLAGDYVAVNFTFARANRDEVGAQDVLLGHTALLEGQATREGATVLFSAVLDAPEDRQLVGLPFEETVSATTRSRVGLRLTPLDPYENDTLFDGLDFAALPADEGGVVHLTPDATDEALVAAYVLLRRTFQTHDHFAATPLESDQSKSFRP